jgi:hypothetical protein
MLLAGRLSFVPLAGAKKIGIGKAFGRMQGSAVPMGDLHGRESAGFAGANTTKAIAAQPPLLVHELFP